MVAHADASMILAQLHFGNTDLLMLQCALCPDQGLGFSPDQPRGCQSELSRQSDCIAASSDACLRFLTALSALVRLPFPFLGGEGC